MEMVHTEKAKKTIHKYAAASAATAGALPVGADATALAAEEILMVIHVAALFGHSIDKETALRALNTGILGTVIGTVVFEGLNVAYPFTIPAKIAVATSVMEALGWSTYAYYESGQIL